MKTRSTLFLWFISYLKVNMRYQIYIILCLRNISVILFENTQIHNRSILFLLQVLPLPTICFGKETVSTTSHPKEKVNTSYIRKKKGTQQKHGQTCYWRKWKELKIMIMMIQESVLLSSLKIAEIWFQNVLVEDALIDIIKLLLIRVCWVYQTFRKARFNFSLYFRETLTFGKQPVYNIYSLYTYLLKSHSHCKNKIMIFFNASKFQCLLQNRTIIPFQGTLTLGIFV